MRIILVALFCLSLFSSVAFAAASPQGLNLQGRIVKSDGQPVDSSNVDFVVQIRSPGAESCLLYEETHSLNMSTGDGVFNIRIGTGVRVGGNFEDTSTLDQIFNNNSAQINSLSCANGDTQWDPGTGDARKLRITFNDGSGAGPQTLAQDQVIQAVPYALNSDRFGGKQTGDFVQAITALEVAPGTTQTRFEQIFNTDYTDLQDLLAGTSALYAKAVPTAAVSNNGQRFTNVADPTSAQDAATKNYSDTSIGGNTANLGTLVVGDSGKVVTWDGTKFVAQAIPSDATKLSLSGGTMTGAINMGGQNILAAGHVQLGNQATLLLGRYDNAQEATLVGGLAAADKGRAWFNTDLNKVRYWDGDSAEDVGAGTVTSVSGTAPVQVATGTTTPVISVDDATGASKGIMQVGSGLSVASGVVSVAFGDVDNTAVEADSIPNCTAVQKLQRSLGPTFTWSCVADDVGTDTGMTALTGDVTAAGSGSQAATISNDAVTYAKMQNVTANKLMGRATAGAGDMEEITLGTALSYTGTTLNVT